MSPESCGFAPLQKFQNKKSGRHLHLYTLMHSMRSKPWTSLGSQFISHLFVVPASLVVQGWSTSAYRQDVHLKPKPKAKWTQWADEPMSFEDVDFIGFMTLDLWSWSVYIYIYVALKLCCYHAHLGCGHAYQTIIIVQTIAIPWISWVECHLIVMAHGVSKFMISALFSLFIALPPGHPWRNNLTCRSQSIEIENTKKKQRHLTQLGIGLDWIQLSCIHRDFIVKNGSWNVWNYH